MMNLGPTFQLTYIVVMGAICQFLGWRLSIPSILFLLLVGITSGPILGLLQPETLFGSLLNPLVELAIAVILFEGGLSLSKAELDKIGKVVLRLLSIGMITVWLLLTLLSHSLLDMGIEASLLLGAILVVSGPTVVIPILRIVRAKFPIEPILRWEGILIDPIGVLLAVLVAEICHSGIDLLAPWHIASGLGISLGVGLIGGLIGAQVVKNVVGRHLVPDQLIVPVTLATLFSVVELSNSIHEQSGLLTSTVMGLFVAYSKPSWLHIVEDFVSHAQRIFVAILFIVLAAKLDPEYLRHLDSSLILFIAAAILLVRPIAVFIATLGTNLSFREKTAISLLAPRGIVSAALASSFGTALAEVNMPGMQSIVPYTFFTIIASVAFYAIFTPIFFRLIGVTQSSLEGVLLMGGGRFALGLGKILRDQGFKVAFVDSNHANVARIQKAGLRCYHGNILSDDTQEQMDLDGIGKLLACTSNDEANSLAAIEFKATFGSANVFQLASSQGDICRAGGRILGNKSLSNDQIEELWQAGYRPYCKDADAKDSQLAPKENGCPDFILAEIVGQKLQLISDDGLLHLSKPNKQIAFGKQ